MMNPELQNNKVDAIVATLKSTLGVVPYAGGIIAELIGNTIPNQRIDRITKFIEILDEKMILIQHDVLEIKMKLPKYIDLFEDCLIASTRALTDERKEHIANLFVNGLKGDEADILNHKKLLQILIQLDDIDLIFLKYFTLKYYKYEGLEKFFSEHEAILKYKDTSIESTITEKNEIESQRIHIRHLINLGILVNNVIDSGTFDEIEPKTIEDINNKYENISAYWLAVMILKEINQLPIGFQLND